MRRTWLSLLCLASAGAAAAQPVVTSARPDSVDVTVYRSPDRGPGEAFDLDFLEGYALISETRRISIPAGESQIRFEGVAAGLEPVTAIVTGFPDGIVERNRDAYLLSPATLLDRSLGRRVTLRRTSHATGAVRETEAVIRTGANGAVVLQTPDGFEALRCSGLPETLIYDEVPRELSSTPTLSVRVRAAAPVTATVTLAYLATGFDWQANYVAELSDDGRRADLFAWLTLASNDDTSFVDADTQAVAGELNRHPTQPAPAEGPPLHIRCWPQETTSDIPLEELAKFAVPPAPPMVMYSGESIVVTGSRIQRSSLDSTMPVAVVVAEEERLGDVRLYRIPEPVTVAANSQKQVAMLQRPGVEVRIVYRQWLQPGTVGGSSETREMLVTRNRREEGLGVPLPGGRIVLFATHEGRRTLVGEGSIGDLTVGQDVEVPLGTSSGVRAVTELVREGGRMNEYRITVTNDHAVPVHYEAEFAAQELRSPARLQRRNGRPLWAVTVPANGTATLRYRAPRRDDKGAD